MAINLDNIEYYNKNVLRAVANWNILAGATVSGTNVIIGAGGAAGYDITNTYNNGLKSCRYRSLSIQLSMSITQQYNYENYVEVVVKGEYKDNSGNILRSLQSINITYLNSNISAGVVSLSRVLKMQSGDFNKLTIYVINHTTGSVTLSNCIMKRSQDINSSQVGESIGWGITINKVVGYIDGCTIHYDGEETPTKMWWQEDAQGVFNGINVNNERIIKFERKNEILLD